MMYHARTKIVSTFAAALGLVLALGQLQSKVIATNTSFPFHHQMPDAFDVPASAIRSNGKIAFASSRNGLLDIFVMDADGSNQRQLTFGSKDPATGYRYALAANPVWSPDGAKIAFEGNPDYGQYNLWVMNGDGTRLRKIFGIPLEG